jgi:hypothetical protein
MANIQLNLMSMCRRVKRKSKRVDLIPGGVKYGV